jgi:hypothetical protein
MLAVINVGIAAILQYKSRFFLLLNPDNTGYLLQEDGSKIIL